MRSPFGSPAYRVSLAIVLWCLMCSSPFAQQPGSVPSDLTALVQSFVEEARQGKPLDNLLSPDVAPSVQQAQLKRAQRSYLDLEISDYRDVELHGADSADLTADIYWRTVHTDFRQTATLHFKRLNGRWYFADFDFMTFNWAYALIGAAVGIGWAVFVLRSVFDWRKHAFGSSTNKALWLVVILIPLLGVVVYWVFVARSRALGKY